MSNEPRVVKHRPPDAELANRGVEHMLLMLFRLLSDLARKVDALHACLTKRAKSHFTVVEVAAITGRTAYTIRRWIAEERIRAIRITGSGPKGRLLIPNSEIAKLIDSGRGSEVPIVVGEPDGEDVTLFQEERTR